MNNILFLGASPSTINSARLQIQKKSVYLKQLDEKFIAGTVNSLTKHIDDKVLAEKTERTDADSLLDGRIGNLDTLTASMLASITSLNADVQAMHGALIWLGTIDLTTSAVTQEALTARAAELGYTTLKHGYTIVDKDVNDWVYSDETAEWVNIGYSSVSQATLETLGVVKSSSDLGKGFVNPDGTISLNGYDALAQKSELPEPSLMERIAAQLQWEDIKASRTTGVEVWTGVMDGVDKVYGRVVAVGNLPNATTKRVPCNIENLSRKINISCIGMAPSTDSLITLPYANPSTSGSILLSFLGNDIYIDTGAFDRSNITAYAFVTYTCTDR